MTDFMLFAGFLNVNFLVGRVDSGNLSKGQRLPFNNLVSAACKPGRSGCIEHGACSGGGFALERLSVIGGDFLLGLGNLVGPGYPKSRIDVGKYAVAAFDFGEARFLGCGE